MICNNNALRAIIVLLFGVIVGFWGCGGGGGGGSGGGRVGRTTETAVRIIHAALDVEPVELRIGNELLQAARFMESTSFAPVSQGRVNFTLNRANVLDRVLATPGFNFLKDTEYSLVLFGERSDQTFRAEFFEEPVVRPKSGNGRVQIINAITGSDRITMDLATGVSLAGVSYRNTSGFVEIQSGSYTATIRNTAGQVISNVSFELGDRAESTVIAAGSNKLDFVVSRVYADLD